MDVRTTPQLEISVLGPLRARRGSDDLALGGRRQKAVLARLALAGGSVVAADRLADELWLGEPPPSAVNTLQSYVSNLRRLLGPIPAGTDADPEAVAPAIERVGEGYRLAVTDAGLASARFERLVGDATSPGQGLGPGERSNLLDEALGLWHGPALAEFADEPWGQGDAVRLEELRLAATEGRFQLLLEQGQHAVIVGDLEQAAAEHPLRERFTAQLVLALYRCGRQAEALRAYERTRSHLGEELGLDPSPELVALAARVLDHDPTLAAPDPADVSAPPPTPRTAGEAPRVDVGPPRGALDLPPAVAERRTRTGFVGRSPELAQAEVRLRLGRAGRPHAGDAGRGARHGEDPPGAALRHLGARPGRSRDVGPLHRREPHRLPAGRRSHPHRHPLHQRSTRPRVARAAACPQDPAPRPHRRPGRSEPGRALRALRVPRRAGGRRRRLRAGPVRGGRHPVGGPLHRGPARPPGAQRSVGPAPGAGHPASTRRTADPELDAMLAGLRRDRRMVAVDIGGIGAGDVADLLEAQGVAVSDEVAAALHTRTGGNPYFVEALAAQGEDLAATDPRALPDSVRDILDQRLATLDPEATRVLTAAAVIGLRVDLELLRTTADITSEALLDVVDAATRAGLLVEDEVLGWVTFPHALVRQALVARTTRNREAQMHLRVADALESRADLTDRAANVAHHLLAAGRLCPPERAAVAALAAGREASNVLADGEARTWADRAAAALGSGAGHEALRAEVDLFQANVARHVGDRDVALAAVNRVVAYARAAEDPIRFASAAREAALCVAGFGFTFGVVDDELVSLLAEALEGLPDDAEGLEITEDELASARGSLLAFHSIASNTVTNQPRNLEEAATAMAVVEGIPDPGARALSMLARRIAISGPPGLEERLAIGPRMDALARKAEWTELVVIGHVLNAVDLFESDQFPAGLAEIDRLAAYIAPFGRPPYDAYLVFLQANLALLRGDLDEAEAYSAQGVSLGEPFHAGNAFQARAAQQYMIARDLGTLGELEPLVEAMVEAYPTMAVWRAAHATCCAAIGEPERARHTYGPVFESGVLELRAESTWYTTVGQLAEVTWTVGDAEASATLADLLMPYGDRMGVTGMGAVSLGPLHRLLGLASAAAGDLDRGAAELELSIARCEAHGFPVWRARAQCELALVLERRGAPRDGERAGALMAEGLAVGRARGVRLALSPEEYQLGRTAATG